MKKEPNPLEDRRRSQEEEYFRKQNADATAKLREKISLQAEGVKDAQLLNDLQSAGFDSDTARALYLFPLIEVAWADNQIQKEEKKEILKLVESQGVKKDSKAYSLISLWLDGKPSDDMYKKAHKLLGPIVKSMKESNDKLSDWVLTACQKVAEATGGHFGIGFKMVSKAESKVIQKIAERLQ